MGKRMLLSALLCAFGWAMWAMNAEAATQTRIGSPRIVFVNPFLRQQFVLSPSGQVASFNPFFRSSVMPFFPNAQTVLFNPRLVSAASFQSNVPSQAVFLTLMAQHHHALHHSGMQGQYGAMNMSMMSAGYGGGYPMQLYPQQSQPAPAPKQAYAPATPAAPASPNLFDLLGLPSSGGRLDWALGLRVLPPAQETKVLRQQIEAELMAAGSQAASGSISPETLKSIVSQTMRLRELLDEHGYKLARATVEHSRQFLDQIETSTEILQEMSKTSESSRPIPGDASGSAAAVKY